MNMPMPLGEMQPDAERHQDGRHPERAVGALAQQEECNADADERRDAVICARPRGTELAQRDDEEHEAHAVAEESDGRRGERARSRRNRPRKQQARPILTAPPASPFAAAISIASLPATRRVELLSIAQHRHASAIKQGAAAAAIAGSAGEQHARRDDERHAGDDARIAMLAKHEPRDRHGQHRLEIEQQACRRPGVVRRPNVNSTGATIPPATIENASQRKSPRGIAGDALMRTGDPRMAQRQQRDNPSPEPA